MSHATPGDVGGGHRVRIHLWRGRAHITVVSPGSVASPPAQISLRHPRLGSRTISTIPHLIEPDVQHGHLPQSAAIRPADGVRPSVAAAARGFVCSATPSNTRASRAPVRAFARSSSCLRPATKSFPPAVGAAAGAVGQRIVRGCADGRAKQTREVVPGLVELEVAVPRSRPAVW